jgi:hypothetical protein
MLALLFKRTIPFRSGDESSRSLMLSMMKSRRRRILPGTYHATHFATALRSSFGSAWSCRSGGRHRQMPVT